MVMVIVYSIKEKRDSQLAYRLGKNTGSLNQTIYIEPMKKSTTFRGYFKANVR